MSEFAQADLIARLQEAYSELSGIPEKPRMQIAETLACLTLRCSLLIRQSSPCLEHADALERLAHRMASLARCHQPN